MHSAIKMLVTRLTLLHQLLLKMQSGGPGLGGQAGWLGAVAGCSGWGQWVRVGQQGLPSQQAGLALTDTVPQQRAPPPRATPPLPALAPSCPAAGELPLDHDLVRQAAGLIKRLPAVDSPQFGEDYATVGWLGWLVWVGYLGGWVGGLCCCTCSHIYLHLPLPLHL